MAEAKLDEVGAAIRFFQARLDDVGVLLTAGVNAMQQFSKDQNSFFVKLLKYVKWFMVLAIVAVALLFGGLIAAIIALVTK